MRRERLLVMIERGQQTGAERYAHREHHTISDSMLEAMSKTVAHYVEQRTMEIEGLQEASEAARTSGRKRFVRYDHEAGRVFLALEVQSQTSLATHCAERVTIPWATYSTESANRHMVMRESFSIQTAYKITYQRGISAREVAVIAAALGAFDEAA
ncbi:MAG: hypothetical protein Q8R07_00645 [Candidatus Uhrbacteria bacterium]|nr:hypothetical protein [Candidatus Uhrbacteria bacterium]